MKNHIWYPGREITPTVGDGKGQLTNQGEPKSFIKTALAWKGSVTPKVLPRVLIAATYSFAVVLVANLFPHFNVPITPFEYSGAVLGILLVLRVNQDSIAGGKLEKFGAASSTKVGTLRLLVTNIRRRKIRRRRNFSVGSRRGHT